MSVVLMYHSLITEGLEDENMEVLPLIFLKHIGWLKDWGFQIVPLRSLLADNQPMQAAITFDDGYSDFLNILPIMAEYPDLSAALFVCCEDLGKRNYWAQSNRNGKELLNVVDIKKLHSDYDQIDILPHGWTHCDFTRMADEELNESLSKTLDWFNFHLNEAPNLIAYPYGAIDDRTKSIVGRHFEYGISVDAHNDSQWIPQLAVPRIQAVNHMSFQWFREQCKEKNISNFIH